MELVTKVLNDLNLNFSKQTIDEVYDFLENEIGIIPKEEELYYICAAAAIVSECQIIPTLDKKSTAVSGIHIENVMKNLPGLSKERFLEVVILEIKKWSNTPNWLLPKIDGISISYRIFKKYQTVFLNLCHQLNIIPQRASNLLSFLWIIQLFMRQEQKDPTSIPDNTILIVVLLRSTFTVLLDNLNILKVDQIIANNFQEIGTISDILNKKYQDEIVEQVLKIYKRRYQDGTLTVKQILNNDILIERLLDDISSLYSELCSHLPKMIVNEMTFLNISKNLTPLHIMHKSSNEKAMDKRLNFDQEDDDELDIIEKISKDQCHEINNTLEFPSFPSFTGVKPIMHEEPTKINFSQFPTMSPFLPTSSSVSHITQTPVSLKLHNMGWIKQCTDTITQFDHAKIQETFEMFQKNQKYASFHKNCVDKIKLLIEQFNKHCFNIEKRQNQIYMLFLYVLKKVIQSHSNQQNAKIFSKLQSLRAILCLSVELFDFSYQSLTGEFRKYCQLLDIQIIQAFKPINWIGRFLNLPKGLEAHLYGLEKQILIREIWNDETGFKIVTSKNNSYVDIAVMRRLERHITQRIQQICKQVGIELKYITKMNSLIKKIMQQKPYLLQHNKIDQIILCSVTFYIRQNSTHTDQTTLADIFNLYNKTSLSYNSIKEGMKSPLGEEMNLLTFYNQVFLQEVQQISKEDDSLLGTPIRLDIIQKRKRGVLATPIPIKFADKSTLPSISHKSLNGRERKNSYQRSLVINSWKNLNNKQENQQDQNEDMESEIKQSPRFGFPTQLAKTFSFAKKK